MLEPMFIITQDVQEKNFGRFIIEPLEKGYGQTLGNSLRRVLLTSLPGAALTKVKIDGVKHQFSTIKGLKEDVVELLMNLKKVRLTIHSDEEVSLSLSKKGVGKITAKDIEAPSDVVIENPDLIIGTLSDSKAQINMTMQADKGRGYITADEKEIDELGVIPVDSLYSPVTRVNYRVEATRVGRVTNLDRLVIEIWTDGTMSSRDSLRHASQILVDYFHQIIDPKEPVEDDTDDDDEAVSEELLNTQIEELDIPTRIVNALANGGIETVRQLMEISKEDLMKIRNLGTKSLTIVKEHLAEKGVNLFEKTSKSDAESDNENT